MADKKDIERQPPDKTNTQQPASITVPGSNIKRMTYAGRAQPPSNLRSVFSRDTADYKSVFDQSQFPSDRSNLTRRSPPSTSSSDVRAASEIEKQLLHTTVLKVQSARKELDFKEDEIAVEAEPNVPDPAIPKDDKPSLKPVHVDTSVSQDIVEAETDDEDDGQEEDHHGDDQPAGVGESPKEDEPQPKAASPTLPGLDPTNYTLEYLIQNYPINFTEPFKDRSNLALKVMFNNATLESLLNTSEEELQAIHEWIRPLYKEIYREWQSLITFCDNKTSRLVRVLALSSAYAHTREGVYHLDDSVRYFIGNFIHIHLDQIQKFHESRYWAYDPRFYQELIYEKESFFLISPMLDVAKPFKDEDLVSLQSRNETVKDATVQEQIDLCRMIIRMAPSLHTEGSAYNDPPQDLSNISRLSPVPRDTSGSPKPTQHLTPHVIITRHDSKHTSPASSRASTPTQSPKTGSKGKNIPLIPVNVSAPVNAQPDTLATKNLVDKDLKAKRVAHDLKVSIALLKGTIPKPTDMVYDASTIPKETDIIDEDEFIRKYGEDCIYPVGTVDPIMQDAPDSQPSTILGIVSGIVNNAYDEYDVTDTPQLKARVLGTHINLPDDAPPFRQLFASDSFPMMILKANNPQAFNIGSTGIHPLPNKIIPPEQVSSQTGTFDPKAMLNAIQGSVSGFSRTTAEGVANLAMPDLTRHSMLSIFVNLWTIQQSLVTCEELGIIPHFDNLVNDDIERIDISAAGAAANGPITQLTNATRKGIPILDVSEINENTMQCMRLASAGAQAIRTPNAHTHELIARRFVWQEQFRWAIIGRAGTIPEVPAHVDVNSTKMLDFIYLLARLFQRTDDMVNGFIRASCMMTVQLVSVRTKNTGVSTRIINSMLEMYSTSIPESRADNFIWRLLGAIREDNTCPSTANEAKFLNMDTPRYYGHMSTAVGAIMSLGYSHPLHRLSITGTTLTSVARNVAAGIVTGLVRDLAAPKPNDYVPWFSRIACGYLPQISAISVCPLAFLSTSWSGHGLTAATTNPTHSWRRLFPLIIPYITQPTSHLRFGLLLDVHWGLSLPGMKVDFKSEVIQYDAARHGLWSAALGDASYAANAKGAMSYKNIPYGCLIINAVMQQTRRSISQPLRFTALLRSNADAAMNFMLLPVPWEKYEFQYIPELCSLRIGTLVNYDWDNSSVRAPALILSEQVEVMEFLLRNTDKLTEFKRAGIQYKGVKSFTSLNTNLQDVIDAQKGAPKASKETKVKTPEVKVDPPEVKTKPPEVETKPPEAVKPSEVKVKAPEVAKVELEVKKAADAIPAAPKVTKKA